MLEANAAHLRPVMSVLERAKRTLPAGLLAFQQRFNRVVVDAARQIEGC